MKLQIQKMNLKYKHRQENTRQIKIDERNRKNIECFTGITFTDDGWFKYKLKQIACKHSKLYIDSGIKYCRNCWKALEIL